MRGKNHMLSFQEGMIGIPNDFSGRKVKMAGAGTW